MILFLSQLYSSLELMLTLAIVLIKGVLFVS